MIDASGWKDQISLPVGRWEGSVKYIHERKENADLIHKFDLIVYDFSRQ